MRHTYEARAELSNSLGYKNYHLHTIVGPAGELHVTNLSADTSLLKLHKLDYRQKNTIDQDALKDEYKLFTTNMAKRLFEY